MGGRGLDSILFCFPSIAIVLQDPWQWIAAVNADSWRAERRAQNYAKAAKRALAKVASLEEDWFCFWPWWLFIFVPCSVLVLQEAIGRKNTQAAQTILREKIARSRSDVPTQAQSVIDDNVTVLPVGAAMGGSTAVDEATTFVAADSKYVPTDAATSPAWEDVEEPPAKQPRMV